MLMILIIFIIFVILMILTIFIISITLIIYFKAFGDWLKTQTEFKYIIDGANVAYNHQNFENGKFSYRQVELVVNKMLARQDGKVLVLLPYSYAQKIVPNSSKQRGKRNITYVSAADQVSSSTTQPLIHFTCIFANTISLHIE